MRISFCLSVALLLGAVSAAACPPSPDSAQLQRIFANNGDLLNEYAQRRWLACGWKAAEPAMREARAMSAAELRSRELRLGEEPRHTDEFSYTLLRLVHADPERLSTFPFWTRPNANTPAPLAELLRQPASPKVMKQHFDEGFDDAIVFLRDGPSDHEFQVGIDAALVGRMIWHGDIDGARARVDRLIGDLAQSRSAGILARVRGTEAYTTLRDTLAPPIARSAAANDEPWVIDRSTRYHVTHCGFGRVVYPLIGDMDALRERVLRATDIDTAISDLLADNWRGLLRDPAAKHGELLAELLRRRHGDAGLRQGWDDAIAMMRTDGPVPTLNLLGHQLPLPQTVREDDAAAPAGKRDRPVMREELEEFVRTSPLYRRSLGLELVALDH